MHDNKYTDVSADGARSSSSRPELRRSGLVNIRTFSRLRVPQPETSFTPALSSSNSHLLFIWEATPHTSTERLLCSRHCARPWGPSRGRRDRDLTSRCWLSSFNLSTWHIKKKSSNDYNDNNSSYFLLDVDFTYGEILRSKVWSHCSLNLRL